MWLHFEGAPTGQIARLAYEIFWQVLPSLVLFLALPLLLHYGLGFWLNLGLSIGAIAGAYLLLLPLLRRFGILL